MLRSVLLALSALAAPVHAQLINPSGGSGSTVDQAARDAAAAAQAKADAAATKAALDALAASAVKSVNAAGPDGTGNVALTIPTPASIATQITTATSGLATTGALSTIAAAIPAPASTVPPPEAVGGAIGTAGTYRAGNAVQPRITRATNCTLNASGACSVTWVDAMPSAPTIVTTPVNPSASQAIMCNTTATPTTTTAAIKCWIVQSTTLSLAIVTAGLNLAPAITAPSGTVVQIIALPPTQ